MPTPLAERVPTRKGRCFYAAIMPPGRHWTQVASTSPIPNLPARCRLLHGGRATLPVREAPLLRSWGMHSEGLALWLLFQETRASDRLREDTFRRMTEYLRRDWFRPLANRDSC